MAKLGERYAWPDERLNRLRELCDRGAPLTQISRELRTSDFAIKAVIARYNLRPPAPRKRRWLPEEDVVIVRMYRAKEPVSAISTRTDRTELAIRTRLDWLRRSGEKSVPRRYLLRDGTRIIQPPFEPISTPDEPSEAVREPTPEVHVVPKVTLPPLPSLIGAPPLREPLARPWLTCRWVDGERETGYVCCEEPAVAHGWCEVHALRALHRSPAARARCEARETGARS
jgi:hypothetical protein